MDAAAVTLLILYLLVKDVVIPLVRKVTKKKTALEECPYGVAAAAKAIEPIAAKIPALEFNLKTHEAKLVDFGELLREHQRRNDETAIAVDNKLDIVLAELKDFREAIIARVVSLETHVEHLLARAGRRGAGD